MAEEKVAGLITSHAESLREKELKKLATALRYGMSTICPLEFLDPAPMEICPICLMEYHDKGDENICPTCLEDIINSRDY